MALVDTTFEADAALAAVFVFALGLIDVAGFLGVVLAAVALPVLLRFVVLVAMVYPVD